LKHTGQFESRTHLVFQRSWAFLTFACAVSAVNFKTGGLVLAAKPAWTGTSESKFADVEPKEAIKKIRFLRYIFVLYLTYMTS
jgi:hypothetical protein